MRAAVIDLGTNTFHLIIAEVAAGSVDVIYKTNVPVRLGEGRINDNIIIPEAFERGISTLKTFKNTILQYEVASVKAIATSAIRSAANGNDFVSAAASQADIHINVINGDDEAGYIFEGVKATGVITGPSLIMDIGGGSTEFILCSPEGYFWKRSYDIGAARLMQAYFHSDPISISNQEDIKNRLSTELPDLFEACEKYQPQVLIGSAGAFETFAGIILKDTSVANISSAELDINAYRELADRLIHSTHAEREAMPDIIPLRVDLIVIASLITNYVLKHTGINNLYLSTYDLKMGVLHAEGSI